MLALDLCFRRGDFELVVNAQAESGVVGVFGPSGCGKSTLLKLVAGLLKPQRGRIQVGDQVLCDPEAGIWVPPHRRRIGMIFQHARLFPHLSVQQNLLYGHRLVPPDQRFIQPDEVIDLLELKTLLGRQPGSLSGGEAQRVALGRALLCSPRLLLCDEPLSALDDRRKNRILPFLRRVRDHFRLPMVYVSHDLGEILQLGSQVWIMEGGRLVARGDYHGGGLDAWLAPNAGDHVLVNVVEAVVRAHQEAEGTTELVLSPVGEPWFAARFEAPLGAKVMVALGADEIALVPERVPVISVQNQVQAVVTGLVRREGRVLCRLDAGVPLVVALTCRGAEQLALSVGRKVFCLFKARAVNLLGMQH
ncbi:molybdenum ABC transporter ATP-binding protein [Acanthopleuribacter pedis]|uniref:Molybdenum ABC transporter ATP-binding protein n=1 Tax=Acanthopleuribacter pedis TaxID=442870 RepID=A0A8J7QN05_9BACT|nr:molybdenum ABC transporter ATP-binding protein [Acanthopleuribacter pedis]MBO1322265.1 molybdenum ABC transporter ATP-binding protein [Acanthopleuribacter pedis]